MGDEAQTRTVYPPDQAQWAHEFQAFVHSLTTRTQQQPDVVDGYKVDEILAHICESAAEQSPVTVRWRI
jgi:predicted dehydrogenase